MDDMQELADAIHSPLSLAAEGLANRSDASLQIPKMSLDDHETDTTVVDSDPAVEDHYAKDLGAAGMEDHDLEAASQLSDVGRSAADHIEAHCSWCLKTSTHSLLGKYGLRKRYHCDSCSGLGAHCMRCPSMARAHTSGAADFLCFECQSLGHWGDDPKVLEVKAYCSWCFKLQPHKFMQASRVGRATYNCTGCQRTTLRCTKCQDGMARGHANSCEKCCFTCDGVIPSWNASEEAIRCATRQVDKWCSWCVNKVDHVLRQRNTVRRHVYSCSRCHNRTLLCVECRSAMACGGHGWDDKACNVCKSFLHSKGEARWLKLHKRKEQVLEKYPKFVSGSQMDIGPMLRDLEKDSKYKKKAMSAGLIRPFLLLVSMHPNIRWTVAATLSISIATDKKVLGNAHAEAWAILAHKRYGMRARGLRPLGKVVKKLSHAEKAMTWISILQNTAAAVFAYSGTKGLTCVNQYYKTVKSGIKEAPTRSASRAASRRSSRRGSDASLVEPSDTESEGGDFLGECDTDVEEDVRGSTDGTEATKPSTLSFLLPPAATQRCKCGAQFDFDEDTEKATSAITKHLKMQHHFEPEDFLKYSLMELLQGRTLPRPEMNNLQELASEGFDDHIRRIHGRPVTTITDLARAAEQEFFLRAVEAWNPQYRYMDISKEPYMQTKEAKELIAKFDAAGFDNKPLVHLVVARFLTGSGREEMVKFRTSDMIQQHGKVGTVRNMMKVALPVITLTTGIAGNVAIPITMLSRNLSGLMLRSLPGSLYAANMYLGSQLVQLFLRGIRIVDYYDLDEANGKR